MADGNNLFVHPAVERMALRRRMADAAEGLLEAAHAIIAELGRDAPDADLEPSLGAPESSVRQVFDWAIGRAAGQMSGKMRRTTLSRR
jgi:hypothetical protein